MKKQLLATLATSALLVLGLGAPALAADTTSETCTPSEAVPATYKEIENPDYIAAYDEVIPAEGEPTIIVDNPDYVPEQTVTHPAVGEPTVTISNPDYVPATVIHHDAIGEPTLTVVDVPAYTIEHEAVTQVVSWEYKQKVTGKIKWKDTPFWNGEGDGHGWDWGWYLTGNTKSEVVTPAWTETIPATYKTIDNPDYIPAWDEEVPAQGDEFITVDNPEYTPEWTEVLPAVGEPTIEIDNPDYVPESTISHEEVGEPTLTVIDTPAKDAVVCPVVTTPTTPASPTATPTTVANPVTPAAAAPVAATPVTEVGTLAHTGSSALLLGSLGAALLASGAVILLARRGHTNKG